MPALKEINSFKLNLASSALASSPLWNMQAERIVPAQLTALKARLKLSDQETGHLFRTIIRSLDEAKQSGELTDAPILRYTEPQGVTMTLHEFSAGLERMTRPMPAAVLFAMEVKLTAEQTITLTWEKVRTLAVQGLVSEYARQILNSQPRHITVKYVFWQLRNNKAQPLYGLELDVFEIYRMVWVELQHAYSQF